MAFKTEPLFRDDAYKREFSGQVLGVNARGGIILDQTAFYAAGGGQPGDTGQISRADGVTIKIGATVYGEGKAEIVHVPMSVDNLPEMGETLSGAIDWSRRNRHMRMHTALHLLCSLVPFPVTGGSIGEGESRLDFDIEDAGAVDKDALSEQLMALVAEDHPVSTRWISEAELDANPGLVRTMSVKPPTVCNPPTDISRPSSRARDGLPHKNRRPICHQARRSSRNSRISTRNSPRVPYRMALSA